MPSDYPTPGLKRRKNADGTERLIWVARADIVKAGYTPKTLRLPYDPNDLALISSACLRYQAEMMEWASGRRRDPLLFDGTVASLVRRYQRDPASPYNTNIKWNTRRTYNQVLETIERAFGKRALAKLTNSDFRRWYEEAKKPKEGEHEERINKATKIIELLRRMTSYGVAAELPECARLLTILKVMRFKQPAPRRSKLEIHHVGAFIEKAVEANRLSLALGTALQFETTLRQRDVIGEWEPIKEEGIAAGIVLGKRRWVNGLTWSDISPALELYKETTKTGAIVGHDLKLCPLVLKVLDLMPPDRRVGPIIIDEKSGRPYAEWVYAREWRAVAKEAGIPKSVWNMDARAGGISEADDAGAPLDEIRSAAGHSQTSTTARYVRAPIGKSRNVALLRNAHRKAKNEP